MNITIQFPEKNYIVFDFETTGVDPDYSEVTEISAIKFIDGAKQPSFSCLIKTQNPIPQNVIDLTHITNEMLEKDGKDPEKTWKEFSIYIQDLPLIAHNGINFDRLFLENAFKKYELPIPSIYRHVDTAMMYKAKKLKEKQRWYESHFHFCKRVSEIRAFGVYFKLALCCQELGIDISKFTAHRAGSDIEMTNLVYQKLINNIEPNEERITIAETKQKIIEMQKRAHINSKTEPNGQIRI
jgi:DNA polymerase III alpha subunit (gram-positive type)